MQGASSVSSVGDSKRGRHKSVDAALDRRLRRLEGNPLIKKVILGATENARHAFTPGTLRVQYETPNGFKVNGYSGNGVVTIHVYCTESDKEEIRNLLSS